LYYDVIIAQTNIIPASIKLFGIDLGIVVKTNQAKLKITSII